MTAPEGETAREGQFARLNSSSYGLKQAAADWEQEFGKTMKKLEFEQGQADPCLWTHKKRKDYSAGIRGRYGDRC